HAAYCRLGLGELLASYCVTSIGLRALLRVPRPLRELLLYLRKAHSPIDNASRLL
ncbi:MAG: hypothetical protein RLZ68_180, partial [Pseudomonadota bacterium]